ncbi:MAG: hypothetical protein AUJ20_01335 [Comamonadaceae bacterium CG1_02_60_18]|nr:MAG: hypothetical protein AUJ20_01335 [Comamonadaceae bacterium CG1_02_60_18]PIQ51007.1 MAG: hypothetical protein COW02_16870 [Comamonadaceae bacterium CG12_big_fil_rev_8_21_14_0_65_59_15]
MSHYTTQARAGDLPPGLDAAGKHVARLLLTADELSPNMQQRLRAAREQAVDKRRQMLALQAQVVWRHAAQGNVGQGWFEQHASIWHFFGSVGMMLVLVLGLWMIDSVQSDEFVSETAEIDKMLLTDDLPPAAYLDPGFKHFVKLSFPSNDR